MTREVAEHGVKQTYSEENIDSDEDSLCRREGLTRPRKYIHIGTNKGIGIVKLTKLTASLRILDNT